MAIPIITRGDTIRAAWLNRIVRTVNEHSRWIQSSAPDFEDAGAPNDPGFQPAGGAGGGGVSATSIVYVESSRTATSRTITDSASDTHTVSLATQIVMVVTGAAGGMPSQITLRFQPS